MFGTNDNNILKTKRWHSLPVHKRLISVFSLCPHFISEIYNLSLFTFFHTSIKSQQSILQFRTSTHSVALRNSSGNPDSHPGSSSLCSRTLRLEAQRIRFSDAKAQWHTALARIRTGSLAVSRAGSAKDFLVSKKLGVLIITCEQCILVDPEVRSK